MLRNPWTTCSGFCNLYRFYFEVGEYEGWAKKIIAAYLGPEKSKAMVTLPHGYEFECPIQGVPDIVKSLVDKGIGVYQVIRYAKSHGEWA